MTVAILTGLSAPAAKSAMVSFDFTATVTGFAGTELFPVGRIASVHLEYDPATAGPSGIHTNTMVGLITLDFGGGVAVSSTGRIPYVLDTHRFQLFNETPAGPPVGGNPPSWLSIVFFDPTIYTIPLTPGPYSPPTVPVSFDFARIDANATAGYAMPANTLPASFLRIAEPANIPEPSAVWLTLAGLACFPILRRRRL